MLIKALCLLGIIISIYSISIYKTRKKRVCDLSKNMSCSKALSSKDAFVFGFHNSSLGLAYYLSLLVFYSFELKLVSIFISLLAVLFSVYLAFKLFRQKNFCLVCIASYALNLALFFLVSFI